MIYIKPEEVWKYFKTNSKSLESLGATIAEDERSDIRIVLTSASGSPYIYVTSYGEVIDGSETTDEEDTLFVAKEMCNEYLFEYNGGNSVAETDYPEIDREKELSEAFTDFVETVVRDEKLAPDLEARFSEIVEDALEFTLQYLAFIHDLPVYRPMEMEDASGKVSIEDYPYDWMDDGQFIRGIRVANM